MNTALKFYKCFLLFRLLIDINVVESCNLEYIVAGISLTLQTRIVFLDGKTQCKIVMFLVADNHINHLYSRIQLLAQEMTSRRSSTLVHHCLERQNVHCHYHRHQKATNNQE